MNKTELLTLMERIDTVFVSTKIEKNEVYFKADRENFERIINGLDEDIEIHCQTYAALPNALYVN